MFCIWASRELSLRVQVTSPLETDFLFEKQRVIICLEISRQSKWKSWVNECCNRDLVGRSPGSDLFQPLKANTILMSNSMFSFLWSGFPLENVTVQLCGKEKKLTVSEQFFLALYCSYVLDHGTAQVRSHLCSRDKNIIYAPSLPRITKSSPLTSGETSPFSECTDNAKHMNQKVMFETIQIHYMSWFWLYSVLIVSIVCSVRVPRSLNPTSSTIHYFCYHAALPKLQPHNSVCFSFPSPTLNSLHAWLELPNTDSSDQLWSLSIMRNVIMLLWKRARIAGKAVKPDETQQWGSTLLLESLENDREKLLKKTDPLITWLLLSNFTQMLMNPGPLEVRAHLVPVKPVKCFSCNSECY